MEQTPRIEKRLPMSSVQRRLYLQCQLPGGDRAYHLLYLARVRGPFPLAAVTAFAAGMIDRHEALRTAFRLEGGEFLAEVHASAELSVTVLEAKEEELDAIVEAHDTPFRLDAPPLLRIVIVRLNEFEHIFLFNCHHLIFDGSSGAVIAGDAAGVGAPVAPAVRGR